MVLFNTLIITNNSCWAQIRRENNCGKKKELEDDRRRRTMRSEDVEGRTKRTLNVTLSCKTKD